LARKSSPRSSPLSRREFGQRVALATGAGIVASTPVSGDVRPAHADGDAGHQDPVNPDDPAIRKLSAEGRVRFESMWQSVLRKHGARLTGEQKTRMRKIIANNAAMLESVYAVSVNNGDAPATTLLLVETAAGKR